MLEVFPGEKIINIPITRAKEAPTIISKLPSPKGLDFRVRKRIQYNATKITIIPGIARLNAKPKNVNRIIKMKYRKSQNIIVINQLSHKPYPLSIALLAFPKLVTAFVSRL